MLPFAERNGKSLNPDHSTPTDFSIPSHALAVKFIRRNIPDNHKRAVDKAIVHAFQTLEPRRTLHSETHFKKRQRDEQHYVNEGAVPGVEIGTGSNDMTIKFSEPNIWQWHIYHIYHISIIQGQEKFYSEPNLK